MNRISNWWHDLRNGIYAIIYWFPIIWKWRTWDYAYTIMVLEHSLKRLRKSIVDFPYGLDKTKRHDAKDLTICINLCQRLLKDQYYWEQKDTDTWVLTDLKIAKNRYKCDKELLFKLLNRKMDRWWT